MSMPSLLKKMETRRLHNSDMKKLVRILRDAPFPSSSSKDKSYRQHTKERIHDLPRRLRSSHLYFSTTSTLCTTHKSLDSHLITEIWAWLRHEFDGAIGKFLYPLIMSSALTKDQEMKVRQLEPVLQMWHSDFDAGLSAPPGRKPIQCGDKWCYQVDQCAACMLARIGSDEGALFALFAGMVGRIKDKATRIDILRGIVGVEKVKSKRLRFIRYWMKASKGGEVTLFRAGELGMRMKRLRHEWKVEQRHLRHMKQWDTMDRPAYEVESPRAAVHVGHQHCASHHDTNTESVIGIDITEPYQPREWSPMNADDPKLGPKPRPSHAKPPSTAASLGFDMSRLSKLTLARSPSNGSDTTVHPGSSISVAHLQPRPLRPQNPLTVPQRSGHDTQAKQPKGSRQDSVLGDLPSLPRRRPSTRRFGQPSVDFLASIRTIMSYDGCASSRTPIATSRNLIDPLDNPVYEIPLTQEQLVKKYRAMLISHSEAYSDPFTYDEEDDVSALPRPRPTSMYSSFGNRAFDDNAYEAADEEVEDEDCGYDHEDDREERDEVVGQCSPLPIPKIAAYRRLSVASTA